MGTRNVNLTPQVDGVRTVFDLGYYFLTGTVQVHLDGILQTPGDYFAETPPSQITTAAPPTVGQELQAQFEVAGDYPLPSGGYTTVEEMRAEGVTVAEISDADLAVKIAIASQQIDRFTGRWFEARTLTIHVDGRGRRMLLLDIPIIQIGKVQIESDLYGGTDVDASYYKVYNRHLTEGLLLPDDRNNPKIELIEMDRTFYESVPLFQAGLAWPRGTQNIRIEGVFGYTDPDGTFTGKTPDLIRHACKLMTLRYIPKLTDMTRDEALKRGWLTSERTSQQSISWSAPRSLGLATGYTGDPEIDQILVQYARPPVFGAV
jgi:hypothetical protein